MPLLALQTSQRAYLVALRRVDCSKWALLITSPQHPSLSRTRRDRLHRPFHNVVTNAKPHIRADAGREPVMETGPDARGYLLGQGIHVGPAARYAGRRRARQRDLGNICGSEHRFDHARNAAALAAMGTRVFR